MILKKINVEVETSDEKRIAELKSDGFVALEDEPEAPKKQESELGSMTVEQLREYAKSHGIEVPKVLRKAEIIELLEGSNNDRGKETGTDNKAEDSDGQE